MKIVIDYENELCECTSVFKGESEDCVRKLNEYIAGKEIMLTGIEVILSDNMPKETWEHPPMYDPNEMFPKVTYSTPLGNTTPQTEWNRG